MVGILIISGSRSYCDVCLLFVTLYIGPLAGISEILFTAMDTGKMYGLDDNPSLAARMPVEIDFVRERGPSLALEVYSPSLSQYLPYVGYLRSSQQIDSAVIIKNEGVGGGDAPGNFNRLVTLQNGTEVYWGANEEAILFKESSSFKFSRKVVFACDIDFCVAQAQ